MDSKRFCLGNASEGLPLEKVHNLNYSIHSWSGHLSNFHPKNILLDQPLDKNSRWSTDSNKQAQYLILELEHISILEKITFGKFMKAHICNLKMFKIYAGIHLNDLSEILEDGLSNDSIPETFFIKYNNNGVFPCKFIKIVPIASWGSRLNYSIWFIKLEGIDEPHYVNNIYQEFNKQLENKAIRLCLKYFRQRNYKHAFKALELDTDVQLEDPTLTQLYQLLVNEGDFDSVEKILEKAYSDSLFLEYCSNQPYSYNWRRIFSYDKNGLSPMSRGGHQLCFDPKRKRIYLFGGWDGNQDLGDFWYFDILNESWNLISENTANENGPGPRSCFKVCLDITGDKIYVFGKYMSSSDATKSPPQADFFCYDLINQSWFKISDNVKNEGGPRLIFDHQMAIDTARQIIYISGGRKILPLGPDMKSPKASYSKLFKYDIKSNNWEKLKPRLPSTISSEEESNIEMRNSHSMVYDAKMNQLILLGGDRNNTFLSDMYVYDIDNNQYKQIYKDYYAIGGPLPGFAQSIILNDETRELCLFTGMSKDKEITPKSICNSIWIFNLEKNTFYEVYKNDNVDLDYWNTMAYFEPLPRFAHQMVADFDTKTYYLFGGNPNCKTEDKGRLDDLWELKLIRPEAVEILRRAKLMLRKHKYFELCHDTTNSLKALKYLREEVFEMVKLDNPQEKEQFQSLATKLFLPYSPTEAQGRVKGSSCLSIDPNDFYPSRIELYEDLLLFFPTNMKQPQDNLVEIIKVK